MSDPSLEMQAAIVKALKDSGALTALLNKRVYDIPPPAPVFPYISLGAVQVLPDKADCIDGTEVFPQIDAWSRVSDPAEIKRVGKAIVAALDDQALTVSDYHLVVFELQSAQYLHDPDGQTRHAALTFRGLLQPV